MLFGLVDNLKSIFNLIQLNLFPENKDIEKKQVRINE